MYELYKNVGFNFDWSDGPVFINFNWPDPAR